MNRAPRWDIRQIGLILAALIVETLLPVDAPILLAIDETLMRRRGPEGARRLRVGALGL